MLELIKNKKFNIYKNLNFINPLVPIATDEMSEDYEKIYEQAKEKNERHLEGK